MQRLERASPVELVDAHPAPAHTRWLRRNFGEGGAAAGDQLVEQRQGEVAEAAEGGDGERAEQSDPSGCEVLRNVGV